MRASSWNQISMGFRRARSPRWALSAAGKFFERLDRPLILSGVTRAGADVGEAERLQELADRALVIGNPEALEDDALQVDPLVVREGWRALRRLASLECRRLRSSARQT